MMTINERRDYFATEAMNAILIGFGNADNWVKEIGNEDDFDLLKVGIAVLAYQMADAMNIARGINK
jgi:hypothetical protein